MEEGDPGLLRRLKAIVEDGRPTGVVTARDTDVGALINAGGGAGPAMFVVSDIKKLRVYVNIPQSYVPAIRIGAPPSIQIR